MTDNDAIIHVESTTDAAYKAMREFTEALNDLQGDEMLGGVFSDFIRHLPEDTRTTLAFQAITHCANGETEALGFKAKAGALALAEEMGPDWAQWLYKFAVLVTKLA